jgi:hypothetical protein
MVCNCQRDTTIEEEYSYFAFHGEVILPKVEETHGVCSKQEAAEKYEDICPRQTQGHLFRA